MNNHVKGKVQSVEWPCPARHQWKEEIHSPLPRISVSRLPKSVDEDPRRPWRNRVYFPCGIGTASTTQWCGGGVAKVYHYYKAQRISSRCLERVARRRKEEYRISRTRWVVRLASRRMEYYTVSIHNKTGGSFALCTPPIAVSKGVTFTPWAFMHRRKTLLYKLTGRRHCQVRRPGSSRERGNAGNRAETMSIPRGWCW